MKYIKAYKGYAIPIGLLGLATVGARTQNLYVLYGLILATCIVVALVAYEKVPVRFYPVILFAIGLSLLYQTTLMSNGLVGTDIHVEYYFYQLAEKNGWNPALAYAYNASIGTVLIAPFMSRLFHIDGVWIFKAVYPLLFAFVCPILYVIYKKQFGDKVAFLSVFFLVTVPTWSLAMIGLPRQMLGELMMVLMAWLVIASTWRTWIKAVLVGVCAILGIMFHYVMGPIILFYLGVSTAILCFFKARKFPIKWLIAVTVVIIIAGIGWYGWVASGKPLSHISIVVNTQINTLLGRPLPYAEIIPPPSWIPEDANNILGKQEPLIRTAFGLDFGKATPLGKVFRMLQFTTQFFLVIGSIYLFFKRKKYSPEYLAWAFPGVVLIGASVFITRFSDVISVTRFYHLVLLFLAPALVLGWQLMFRNLKWLTVGLLLPYFIFTSGAVFELSQSNDASSIDIPYAIALSHERVGVAAVFSENDIAVRDWAIANKKEPVFTDINGMLLFTEIMPQSSWHPIRSDYAKIVDGGALLPGELDKLPITGYVFLREWNTRHNLMTFMPNWYALEDNTTGMRQSYTLGELGLGELLNKSRVVYRSGDAILYEFTR